MSEAEPTIHDLSIAAADKLIADNPDVNTVSMVVRHTDPANGETSMALINRTRNGDRFSVAEMGHSAHAVHILYMQVVRDLGSIYRMLDEEATAIANKLRQQQEIRLEEQRGEQPAAVRISTGDSAGDPQTPGD